MMTMTKDDDFCESHLQCGGAKKKKIDRVKERHE